MEKEWRALPGDLRPKVTVRAEPPQCRDTFLMPRAARASPAHAREGPCELSLTFWSAFGKETSWRSRLLWKQEQSRPSSGRARRRSFPLPAHHGHSGRRVRQSVRPELALGCALRLCSSWLLLHWRCGLDAEQLAARSLNQSRAGKGGCASCAPGRGGGSWVRLQCSGAPGVRAGGCCVTLFLPSPAPPLPQR